MLKLTYKSWQTFIVETESDHIFFYVTDLTQEEGKRLRIQHTKQNSGFKISFNHQVTLSSQQRKVKTTMQTKLC